MSQCCCSGNCESDKNCCDNKNEKKFDFELPFLILTAVLLAGGLAYQSFFAHSPYFVWFYFLPLYLIAGFNVLKTAVINILKGDFFDENFLMTFATVAAWVVQAGAESASVMIFYQWGEYIQEKAVEKSKRSLSSLLAQKPRSARVLSALGWVEKPSEEVQVAQLIEVKAGETIPLDGIIEKGSASLDLSALTGESLPVGVLAGSEVPAGGICRDGVLQIKVIRPFSESAWAMLLQSVERALKKKAPMEKFITRFAKVYTPLVILAAALVFLLSWFFTGHWQDSLYRSLVLLVISCPCALVISIPLTYMAAIGLASRKGFIIKGSDVLDKLIKVDSVVWDKTGTLSEGKPRVKTISGPSEEWLDRAFSTTSHPLASSWKVYRKDQSFHYPTEEVKEFPGEGVRFHYENKTALLGRAEFLKAQGVSLPEDIMSSSTVVHAAEEGIYLGYASFEDLEKPTAAQAIQKLKDLKIPHQALLSGDLPTAAQVLAQRVGIMNVKGGLKPEGKVSEVENLTNQGRKVLFVGDGLNDAPVLANSWVGVSLGAQASASAMETADVTILDQNPLKVPQLLLLGLRTKKILYQNIAIALGIKSIFMLLGAFGLASLWEAVFADVGVALLAVLNSLRAAKD